MKFHTKIAMVISALALGAAPAIALAAGGPPATVTTGPPAGLTTGPPSTVITGPPSTLTTGPPSSVTTGPPSSVAPANQGTVHKPTNAGSAATSGESGPTASLPAKAKAYGHSCQGESKRRVAGQKGTPFSQCVTAMAKVATGSTTSPQAACRAESRKRVAGQHGTPFSLCVSAAAKLASAQQSGTGHASAS